MTPEQAAQAHYIINVHVFGMDKRSRDKFLDRIIDEVYRYEEDGDAYVIAGPCDEGEECHGEEADLQGSSLDGWLHGGYSGCRYDGADCSR